MTRYSLGISATSYLSVWQTIDTLEFLERCHKFGAAGIHAVLNRDPAAVRARAESYGMYVEAMVPLPAGDDTTAFEQALKDAQTAGAVALRAACLGTRRYETFQSLDAWRAHLARSHRSLAAAVPLLDKYKIPLGLENHKDWTAGELAAIVQQYSSEYFGVCLDFGNNISLLDDPMEAIEQLSPYTVSTHVKDIALATYDGGILLSETVLGSGLLDLPRAVKLIHQARPATRMTLEMITRDPLEIPMLTDAYWATFPDKTPRDLARTLHYVNLNRTRAHLASDEDQNVAACLAAWETTGLSDLLRT